LPDELSSSDDFRLLSELLPEFDDELLLLSSVQPGAPAVQPEESAEAGAPEIAIRDSTRAETPDRRRVVRFIFFLFLQTLDQCRGDMTNKITQNCRVKAGTDAVKYAHAPA
jgi:hypothetical protein